MNQKNKKFCIIFIVMQWLMFICSNITWATSNMENYPNQITDQGAKIQEIKEYFQEFSQFFITSNLPETLYINIETNLADTIQQLIKQIEDISKADNDKNHGKAKLSYKLKDFGRKLERVYGNWNITHTLKKDEFFLIFKELMETYEEVYIRILEKNNIAIKVIRFLKLDLEERKLKKSQLLMLNNENCTTIKEEISPLPIDIESAEHNAEYLYISEGDNIEIKIIRFLTLNREESKLKKSQLMLNNENCTTIKEEISPLPIAIESAEHNAQYLYESSPQIIYQNIQSNPSPQTIYQNIQSNPLPQTQSPYGENLQYQTSLNNRKKTKNYKKKTPPNQEVTSASNGIEDCNTAKIQDIQKKIQDIQKKKNAMHAAKPVSRGKTSNSKFPIITIIFTSLSLILSEIYYRKIKKKKIPKNTGNVKHQKIGKVPNNPQIKKQQLINGTVKNNKVCICGEKELL